MAMVKYLKYNFKDLIINKQGGEKFLTYQVCDFTVKSSPKN